MKHRWITGALVLLAFGFLRVPVEKEIESDLREGHFRAARLDMEMRQQLGQMAYAVALGGFRSTVASALNMKAYVEWENVAWDELGRLYDIITSLQPRTIAYWDSAHWHMAYNASAFYRDHSTLKKRTRARRERHFIEEGKRFLLRGIRNNPEEYRLPFALGILYAKRDGDHCAAAEAYAEALACGGAPDYVARFHAYELADCPGHEKEAYALLADLYRRDPKNRERLTLLQKLGHLEDKLGIAPEERLLPGGE